MRLKYFGVGLLAIFLLVGAGCSQKPSSELNLEDTPSVPQPEQPAQPPAPPEQIENESMSQYEFPGALPAEQIENKQIRIETEKGDIVFELFADTAPLAVSNFVYLTGEDFYDGLTFHRREEGFVIQGGDPNGDGTGGPGYSFEDELDDDHAYGRGMVAMANRGPDTNGSQFFIMLKSTPLPKSYTVFGRVLEGMDVVDEIAVGDVMENVEVEEQE